MKRLLDDPRFAGELRADLLRSRSAGQDYPTAAKLLQLRAAFSDNAPAADGGIGSTLKHAARGAHPGWKLAVLAALGGGAGFLGYAAQREAPAHHAAVHQPADAPPPPAASAADAALPPGDAAPLAPEPATLAPEPTTLAPEPATRAPEPTTRVPAALTRRGSNSDASRREIAQLVRMRALLEQDPAAAYRLAQRGEREFPRGILAQERQALAIVALASTGARDRARKSARQFFTRYPQSPLRETVEAALQR